MESQIDMSIPIVHRRRSSVWRPTLDRDCTNSAVLVALQINAERSSLKAAKTTPSTKIDWATELDAAQAQLVIAEPEFRAENHYEQDTLAFQCPPLHNRNAFHIFDLDSDMDNSSEHTSPISDTTLFDDDLDVWPTSHPTGAEFMQRRTAEIDVLANQGFRKTYQKCYKHIRTPVERKGIQHSRHSSSGSVFDAPIPHDQLSGNRGDAMMDTLTAEEREMEYKHRHTFIGTASLDEFLEILEISSSHCVTQSAVARAFIQLASTEQLYARQYSTKPDGWGLVARTTVGCKDVATDYVVQSQVRLGTITLRQFLNMIPFDQNNMVAATKVLDAFSAASHLHVKRDLDVENKARAFRSWIISQTSMQIATE